MKLMKHGCVVLADVHHSMLEVTKGLLEAIFTTVVMVSSYESLLEASQKIRPDLIITLSSPSMAAFTADEAAELLAEAKTPAEN
jgi:CheY-like chemotaxis protein